MRWRLLEGVDEADARAIMAAARRRTFARNEVIFHEEDPGDSLLMISSGHVAVRVTTPLGETAVLDVLGPGDVLGEMAVIGEEGTRSATAVALDPVEAMSLGRETFEHLCERHPRAREVLVRLLVQRLRRTSAQLLEALYVGADTRVRRSVLRLAELYGGGTDPQVTIPLNQEDLAGLAGTTRATVNRVLRAEQERGTVSLARGKVVVEDPAGLAKRAR